MVDPNAPVAEAGEAPAALRGHVALVTGAAQGLGTSIAGALAAAGARVVLADADPEVLQTAERLAGQGGDVLGVIADVADEAQWHGLLREAVDAFGFVDVLVNNAARTASTSLWEITPHEWDAVMAVNLRGCFLGCRTIGRQMRARGRGGRIVNLASLAGQQASPATGVHYAASKAGVLALTRSFAAEFASDAITVNAVAPATIHGPALEALSPERRQSLLANIPLGRFGQPDEVSGAVLFLASAAAAFVTGATLDVNGGRLMR